MPLIGTGAPTQVLIQKALTNAGAASLEDWVVQHPGEHLWVEMPFDGYTVPACAACTHIRFGRDGKKNKPCRGIAPPVRFA
jgi:hypothetical protein